MNQYPRFFCKWCGAEEGSMLRPPLCIDDEDHEFVKERRGPLVGDETPAPQHRPDSSY
nr:MAG TPA: Rubredoxin-like zinc ribbon domain protein [Caudoviricetes sp.]